MRSERWIVVGLVTLALVASGVMGLERSQAQTNSFASFVTELRAAGVPVQAATAEKEGSSVIADIVLPANASGTKEASDLPRWRLAALRQAVMGKKSGLVVDRVRVRELDAAGLVVSYLELPVDASELPDTQVPPAQTEPTLGAALGAELARLPLAGATLDPVIVTSEVDGTRTVVIHLVVQDLAQANTSLPGFMWGQRALTDTENARGAGIAIVRVEADAADGTALLRYVRDTQRREEQASLADGVNPEASMPSAPGASAAASQ
jgi:hypothetical protein